MTVELGEIVQRLRLRRALTWSDAELADAWARSLDAQDLLSIAARTATPTQLRTAFCLCAREAVGIVPVPPSVTRALEVAERTIGAPDLLDELEQATNVATAAYRARGQDQDFRDEAIRPGAD